VRDRRAFISAVGGSILAFAPLAAEAQPAGKVPRISYLANNLANGLHLRDAFLYGLRDLGYVEGGNVVIEYRNADGKYEGIPDLARALNGRSVRFSAKAIVGGPIARATETRRRELRA